MINRNFSTLSYLTTWDWNQDNSLFHIYDLQNPSFQTQIIAQDLSVPWAMEVSEDGRLFFTERGGTLRVVEYGMLNQVPVHAFGTPFVSNGEGGLMGLALDRDFLTNGYIYLMYTYGEDGGLFNRVVRMRVEGNAASEEEILLDRIPAGPSHNGGRLKIGPDGYLYITTGDAGDRNLSQDRNSLAGKILRIGTDGSIPPDNPFPGSPVYALGLRNPQGLAWNDNNVLYASDHGERAHDEINIIEPGGNYGWPLVTGDEEMPEYNFIRPVLQSGDTTWAPSGITFVTDGPRKGQLLVATLRGNVLLAVTFDETGTQVVQVERLLENDYGRLRDVYEAIDGSIYLSTNNKDGRGLPNPGDDKILRL